MQQILDQADQLAARFEQSDPTTDELKDAAALRELRSAVLARADADRAVAAAIVAARRDGHSWASIGAMVGTSGQAAREKYGSLASA